MSGEGQQLQERVEVLDNSMEQSHRISVFAPLGLNVVALVCTIIIYLLLLRATVNLIRRERRRGRVGTPWTALGIFARVVFYASLTHSLEIACWAVLFMICGEFSDFGTAFYHSAVNYTSLGYGDLIMLPSWRRLGPLETANGMLLFGVSTAITCKVQQHPRLTPISNHHFFWREHDKQLSFFRCWR